MEKFKWYLCQKIRRDINVKIILGLESDPHKIVLRAPQLFRSPFCKYPFQNILYYLEIDSVYVQKEIQKLRLIKFSNRAKM